MKKLKLFLLNFLLVLSVPSVFAQNGLSFDGSNDYVQTTSTGVLSSNNRTFEAWINLAAAPSSNSAILDYGLNAVGSRNTFMITSNSGINFTSGGTNANIGSAANIIPVGQWVHVAFVLDNAVGYLYVDGIQVATGNLSSVSTPTGGTDLRIGQRVTGGSIPFNGEIDEVRVWSVARTQQEIADNMNNEICGTPSDLVVYYKFDEGVAGGTNTTVDTAFDEVTATNDGTLTNFALSGATSNWVVGNSMGAAAVINNQVLTGCAGFSVTVGTSTYSTTGVYSDVLVGASVDGCDSIVNTDLTIGTAVTNNQTLTICSGASVTVGTNTYSTTGVYTDVLVGASSLGCDSTVITDLSVSAPIIFDQNLTICAGSSITVGTSTYTTTGTYTDVLVGASVEGCDSTVNTDLTVSAEIINTQTLNECNGFSVTVGSNTYDATGVYTDVFPGASASGCDSTVITDLTIAAPVNVAVTNVSAVLTADETGAMYQWLDCDNGNAPITGETNQVFTPSANGNYAVEVTVGNCTDTSDCEVVSTVSVDSYLKENISIFPNPTSSNFQVDLGAQTDVVNYSVTSVTGQVILQNTKLNTKTISIDLTNEPKGVYFLNLNNRSFKVVKN